MQDAIVNLAKSQNFSEEETAQALKGEGRGGPDSGAPLGFDHNWVIRGYSQGQLSKVAQVTHAESGRQMKVSSDTPGV